MGRLSDRLAGFCGWMRLRVLDADPATGIGAVRITGRTGGLTPRAFEAIVRDIVPPAKGTIDVAAWGDNRWRIRLRGRLASPALEQRLRNVLVNL